MVTPVFLHSPHLVPKNNVKHSSLCVVLLEIAGKDKGDLITENSGRWHRDAAGLGGHTLVTNKEAFPGHCVPTLQSSRQMSTHTRAAKS